MVISNTRLHAKYAPHALQGFRLLIVLLAFSGDLLAQCVFDESDPAVNSRTL